MIKIVRCSKNGQGYEYGVICVPKSWIGKSVSIVTITQKEKKEFERRDNKYQESKKKREEKYQKHIKQLREWRYKHDTKDT